MKYKYIVKGTVLKLSNKQRKFYKKLVRNAVMVNQSKISNSCVRNRQNELNIHKSSLRVGKVHTNNNTIIRITLIMAYITIGLFFVSTYYSFLGYEYNYFLAMTLQKYPFPPINMSSGKMIWRPFLEEAICVVKQYKIYTWDYYQPLYDFLTGKKVLHPKVAVLMFPETIETKLNWATFYSKLTLATGIGVLVSIMYAFS